MINRQMLRDKGLKLIKNKYILALLLFVIWILFFDQNNLMVRIKQIRELQQFEKDIVFYKKKIIEDSIKIDELKAGNNIDKLEKFAREQYLMKKENEDIFIIVEEE